MKLLNMSSSKNKQTKKQQTKKTNLYQVFKENQLPFKQHGKDNSLQGAVRMEDIQHRERW